jgi:hypothetical protein
MNAYTNSEIKSIKTQTISEEKKTEIQNEVEYLQSKDRVRSLIESAGHENILRYMIEDLDTIDDINNTQSMYLFKLISSLEEALQIYPRIKNAV